MRYRKAAGMVLAMSRVAITNSYRIVDQHR